MAIHVGFAGGRCCLAGRLATIPDMQAWTISKLSDMEGLAHETTSGLLAGLAI